MLHFHYSQVGIQDLPSQEYLAENDPIATMLATLMKAEDADLAAFKSFALYAVVDSLLSDNNKLFLVELVNTYLPTAGFGDVREEIMNNWAEIEMK